MRSSSWVVWAGTASVASMSSSLLGWEGGRVFHIHPRGKIVDIDIEDIVFGKCC